jgi:hypothetical protein
VTDDLKPVPRPAPGPRPVELAAGAALEVVIAGLVLSTHGRAGRVAPHVVEVVAMAAANLDTVVSG